MDNIWVGWKITLETPSPLGCRNFFRKLFLGGGPRDPEAKKLFLSTHLLVGLFDDLVGIGWCFDPSFTLVRPLIGSKTPFFLKKKPDRKKIKNFQTFQYHSFGVVWHAKGDHPLFWPLSHPYNTPTAVEKQGFHPTSATHRIRRIPGKPQKPPRNPWYTHTKHVILWIHKDFVVYEVRSRARA